MPIVDHSPTNRDEPNPLQLRTLVLPSIEEVVEEPKKLAIRKSTSPDYQDKKSLSQSSKSFIDSVKITIFYFSSADWCDFDDSERKTTQRRY